MGNCFYNFARKDIISEKSLIAVKNVIDFLKEDVIQRDIFRATRHNAICQQIAKELQRGSPALYRLIDDSSVRDIAGGLMYFLMYLKKPLIPTHIQAIVLDPDNKTICPEVVAQDALGLIKQEVHGRQYQLLQYIFDLLNHVLKCTPTDELAGCNVPISMMPIFFNLQAEHIMQWRRVATIFVELIRFAPAQLNIPDRPIEVGNNMLIQNFVREDEYGRANHFILQRIDDLGLVLRRYITRTGNRGDSTSYEVYEGRPRKESLRHRPSCVL